MKQQQYNVGVYARLSNEDSREGNSVSIENQLLMLNNYASKNNWEVCETYIDDGYSGGNFNRPAFQRLLRDAQSGKINLVLVKDQSRFGRNVVEAGMIKQTFEDNEIRLIAVDDNLDTANGFDIMATFRDVFNEWFIADTSKKIKAVKKAQIEKGNFMGYRPPFGYERSQENRTSLVVDPFAAEIVRKIFDLRCKGNGFRTIANLLNNEGVISPKAYRPNASGKQPLGELNWNSNTISKILRNEIYIGNMVQGKTETISYKHKKCKKKPQSEWVRVEGTHEAIIDKATWELVRELDERIPKQRSAANGENYLFSGIVRCLDCGYGMKVSKRKSAHTVCKGYICGKFSLCGKTACSMHYIGLGTLEKLVVDELRKHAARAFSDEEVYRDELLKQRNEGRFAQRKFDEDKLKRANHRIAELERLLQSAYEDKVDGTLSVEFFKTLSAKYESEYEKLRGDVLEIEPRLAVSDSDLADVDDFLETIKKYVNIERLDREILIELIEKIEIGEIKVEDGVKVRDVVIHYRFVDTVNS